MVEKRLIELAQRLAQFVMGKFRKLHWDPDPRVADTCGRSCKEARD
jgi:hypothetical protein